MSREEKLERQLGAVEAELRRLLLTVLAEQAAGGRSLVFVNEQFNPLGLRQSWLDPVAAEVLKLSLEAQDLRTQLGQGTQRRKVPLVSISRPAVAAQTFRIPIDSVPSGCRKSCSSGFS